MPPVAEHRAVTQVSPELRLIFRGHLRIALGVFQKRFAGFRIGKVLLVGEGCRDTAGDVAENFRFTKDRFAGQAAADIAVNGMRNVGTGTVRNKTDTGNINFGLAQIGCRVTGGITQFDGHDDFGQFLPDMGFFVDIVDFGGQCCRSQNNVADGRFAAGVGMAMEQGEQKRQAPPC